MQSAAEKETEDQLRGRWLSGALSSGKKLPLQLWAGFRLFLRELGDALPQKVAKSRRSRLYYFMFFEDVGSV